MIVKWIAAIVLLCSPLSAWAQSTAFDQAIQDGQAFGHAQPQGKDAASGLIDRAIQNQSIPGLTPQTQSDATAQGSFYLDNPSQLDLQGQGALSTTEGGLFLGQSYNLRSRSVIAPDDPLITGSQQAASGTQGCITQRVCTQPTSQVVSSTRSVTCSIEYAETTGQCTYALPQPTTAWRPWLSIELVGQNGYWTFRLRADTSGDGVYDLTLTNPSGRAIRPFHTSGQVLRDVSIWGRWLVPVYWGLTSSGAWYNPPRPTDSWWWVDRSGPYINRQTAAGYLKELVRQAFAVPSSEIKIQAGSEWFGEGTCFGLGGDRCYSVVWERSYTVPPPPLDQATIQAACGAYLNDRCTQVNEQCTATDCTRSYVCADTSQVIDGCATYRSQGCTLQSSTCALTNAYGQCLAEQQTYACTTQTIQEGCAQESVQVICPGSPSGIRCLDPTDCADTTSVPSMDMALATSHMASLNAIEDDHTANPLVIFTGSGESCRRTIASGLTRDCCALATALLGCNANEELLQTKRQNGQCVQIGTYCSRDVNLLFGSVCVEHTTSFCCFSSKLTRIIQEQGRPQLGIGWGSAQSPDCRGFTPEELQRINFQAIDFSEYSSTIVANPPDPAQLSSQTQSSPALVPDPSAVPPATGSLSNTQVQQDLDQFFQTHTP